MDDLAPLVSVIKQKKELSFIDDAFVLTEIDGYFQKNPSLKIKYIPNTRSATFEKIVKAVRANLRRSYGLFRKAQDVKVVSAFLDENKGFSKEETMNLLSKHSSTRERNQFYPSLYDKIFAITGSIRSIVDLGCGLNPLSLVFFKKLPERYEAYDLSLQEMDLLGRFFSTFSKKCQGSAHIFNVLDVEQLLKLERADVCFLFKMTDVLDKGKGHRITEGVLSILPCHFAVVSFSTLTMSGKKMTAPQRTWLQWLCKRKGWLYSILEFENEIFYVIEKGR